MNMPPKCEECRGACCEAVLLSPYVAAQFDTEWLRTRGKLLQDGWVELESRCPKLSEDGRCTIYATRPLACQTYKEGGLACMSAVIRRRKV